MLALLGIPSASQIAKDLVNDLIGVIASLLASGVSDLLKAILGFIGATTDPSFTSRWWEHGGLAVSAQVLEIAGAIAVLALMLAAFEGIWTGSTTPIVKAVAAMPGAFIKTAVLVPVTSLLVSASDSIADLFDASIVSHIDGVALAVGTAIAATDSVGMILAGVIIVAVLGLWAELALRVALVYLVVINAPMVIMASVHPRARQAWHKLVEMGAALIFSKILVAIALEIGFSQIGALTTSGSFATDVGALIAGVATLAVACFSPFLLFRMISAELAQFEGVA
ncbi:MAG TPA: hypothetical protein VMD59_11790, partial [Acidimicrobiales bacterium]|nr:hypothetical protein [Acidimicrobiales bacterium]